MLKRISSMFVENMDKKAPVFEPIVKRTASSNFSNSTDWYAPVILSPQTIGAKASYFETLESVLQVLQQLESDEYLDYVISYYQAGLNRFGEFWKYADIVTVLIAAAEFIRPSNYLEIGVRRGRSMSMVASTCPECEIFGFDKWSDNYAGMNNPGPDFVRSEMKKVGHKGRIELISGNSHQTLPEFFKTYPAITFDLITVDGDHSENGAEQDLRDILPRLNIGGAVVFDDICHPKHPYLADVWHRMVADNHRFSTWEFTELGYGVAVGVRKEQ